MSPFSEDSSGRRRSRRPRSRAAARRRPDDRYSRFIGWMKYVLPGTAVVLVGLVLAWPLLEETSEQVARQAAELARTGPVRDFEMHNPRYEGTDDEGRPYTMTASAARQASLGANEVMLDEPRARVQLENGNFLTLTSRQGEFRQNERILILTGDVNAYHDAGYTFRTERAILDMNDNTAHGNQPVTATGPKGNLAAQGFRVLDDGKTVYFTGRSRIVLNLTGQDMRQITGESSGHPGQ